ncbi:MAG: hypothetical protein NVS3B21_13730 [Acidimicrobiales bacterium]
MPRRPAARSVAARLLALAVVGVTCGVALPASAVGPPGTTSMQGLPRGATAGVLHRHLAYETELAAGVLLRLGPSDTDAVQTLMTVTHAPMSALAARMVKDHQTDASARRAWDARVGTGAPRPGERTHFACSIGIRRSDAAALSATPDADLGEEFASIELGLVIEGRQLAAALAPNDGLRLAVDAAQRQALHALVPLLIPTDRAFAASA